MQYSIRMVELVSLGELSALAAAAPTARNFTAVIQHITSSKRMRLDRHRGGAPSRVASYHVMHLADKTKSFFKLLCWGDALPMLRREDHDGIGDTSLCVGDIVLFSKCTVKSFRGNVEAQYTRHSSVQLLYRRDRYFNTRDVRLKDFYPMIDWYKKHRHQFLLIDMQSGEVREPVTSTPPSGPFTLIRGLREDMLASLKCTILENKKSGDEGRQVMHEQNSSDYDGAQLREVTMKDERNDTMTLNLWDQFADSKFAARLVAHRGPVEVIGVIISLNSISNQLLANTTPRTEFRFMSGEMVDIDSADSSNCKQLTVTSIAALKSSHLHEGSLVLENVTIEHLLLSRFVGKTNRVEASFVPLLLECFCFVCGLTLPIDQTNTIPEVYGSCQSGCRVKPGGSERKWRFRPVQMVLCDTKQDRLTVTVTSEVLTHLLGNIDPGQLVDPRARVDGPLVFDPHRILSRLMNAITQANSASVNQLYRVQLKRAAGDHVHQLDDSFRQEELLSRKDTFLVVAILPITDHLW